jgi:hypothetical protein
VSDELGPNELAKRQRLSAQMQTPEWQATRAPEFKRGRSANPGGRPASLPRFRKAARENSFIVMAEIMKRISDPDVPLGELIRAFAELSDRGGHIRVTDAENIDLAKARACLAALALPGLNDEQRQLLLASLEG